MGKRLALLFAALMVLGFVVAGCGDDDDDGGGSGSSDNAAETEKKSDSGGSSGDVPDNPQVKQAVEACTQSVNSAAQLKADTKAALVEICEEGAQGDGDAVRKASKDVCRKIVEDTVPAGNPGREQALASCDQAGGTP